MTHRCQTENAECQSVDISTKPLFTRQAMLSNTQSSKSTLVSIAFNIVLGPTPLEGGQSCLGVQGQETVNLEGGDKWGYRVSAHVLSCVPHTWQSRGAHQGFLYLLCYWHSILSTSVFIHCKFNFNLRRPEIYLVLKMHPLFESSFLITYRSRFSNPRTRLFPRNSL